MLSLFFLTVLLYPLKQMQWSDLFELTQAQEDDALDKQDQLEESLMDLAVVQLESNAKTLLDQAEIAYEKVTITIHNTDETGITISRLFVLLCDADQIAATEDCLQSYYGILPEIEVQSDD